MSIRHLFLRYSFILVFLAITLRLGQVMLLQHRHYNVLAQQQHVVQQELAAQRGEIYTADGYPLVINTDVYLMFAVPVEMDNKDEVREKLLEEIIQILQLRGTEPETVIIDIEDEESLTSKDIPVILPADLHSLNTWHKALDQEDEFKEKLDQILSDFLDQDDNLFVQILKQLEEDEKNAFKALDLDGIHFQRGSKRVYPEQSMASHLLGFVGKDEAGMDQGYFGAEGYFDGDLSGRSGYELKERDVIGQEIPFGISKLRKPSHGRDLVLTIRREIQHLVERKIKEGVERYDAEYGSGIIMDPESGTVWAMANFPDYLPEYWTDYLEDETDVSKVDVYSNPAISSNYEPGSVFKPITLSIAMNENIVTPKTVYQDSGPVIYSGSPVRTWNNKYHGEITMTQILQLSNNTGAAWVGHQIGFDKYADYLSILHLGEKTGLDLEGEEGGIVRPRRDWRDIDLANMAFGQGVSVTPLQLTAVFSALINGGVLYEPYVVGNIIDHRFSEPIVIERQPQVRGKIISQEVSDQIRLMMRKVVTDGEFKWFVQEAGMDRFSIGGKTGTAQIPVGGRYDPDKTNTTFVGFAPVQDPEFVLLVRFNQPTTSTFSADTAVPLWMEIAKELVVYFEIAPGE